MTDLDGETQSLQHEIAGLEARPRRATAQLQKQTANGPGASEKENEDSAPHVRPNALELELALNLDPSHHALLLLSDSALPLGSFAFSSGLESYLAHRRSAKANLAVPADFHRFLRLSLASLAVTALPYVLAAYRDPARLETLDNDFDASTPCTVARRASTSQGRALMGVWERAFRVPDKTALSPTPTPTGSTTTTTTTTSGHNPVVEALEAFRLQLRTSSSTADDGDGLLAVNGHFPPLWGCVSRAMGLSLPQTAYVFLFNHVKALLSAGVRASVMGPYQAQGVLAAEWVQRAVRDAMVRGGAVEVEDAGQTVPVLDLYQGRHELLYSRIFNS